MNIETVIDALAAGTADPRDVYRALGWHVQPHEGWFRRTAVRAPGGERLQGIGNVTHSIDDALHLVVFGREEQAVAASLTLNRPFTSSGTGDVVARRICALVLLRPEFRRLK